MNSSTNKSNKISSFLSGLSKGTITNASRIAMKNQFNKNVQGNQDSQNEISIGNKKENFNNNFHNDNTNTSRNYDNLGQIAQPPRPNSRENIDSQ